jgi:hypothetical protein
MLRDEVDMVKGLLFWRKKNETITRSRKYETVQRCPKFVARFVFRLTPLFCAREPYLRHILNHSNYVTLTIPD